MVWSWEKASFDFCVVVGALLEASRQTDGDGLHQIYRQCLLAELKKFEENPALYRLRLNVELDKLFVVGGGE